LAHVTSDLGRAAGKFNLNRGPSQVGALGEISNGGHEGKSGRDVVEEPLRASLGKRQTPDGKSTCSEDGGDSEVPVATTSGDVVVGRHRVGETIDVECSIRHFESGWTSCGEREDIPLVMLLAMLLLDTVADLWRLV